MPGTPSEKSEKPQASAVEFEPPLACVRRILKHSLPTSTNVGKDASSAFARACGIFIIYVTACANDFAREHKRQTITANDVLAAVKVSVCSVCLCGWPKMNDTDLAGSGAWIGIGFWRFHPRNDRLFGIIP